mmetsp:Transcript_62365/g.167309  ORF Transcript_62365/g.167309 Transcript_62365/m.167309 type:complete len:83 (+) Transcript_62365:162-410(+)
MNHIAQGLVYDSPLTNPADSKIEWNICGMAYMQFLIRIPQNTAVDWDEWDIEVLIDETNAQFPGRITPFMAAHLLQVEQVES